MYIECYIDNTLHVLSDSILINDRIIVVCVYRCKESYNGIKNETL